MNAPSCGTYVLQASRAAPRQPPSIQGCPPSQASVKIKQRLWTEIEKQVYDRQMRQKAELVLPDLIIPRETVNQGDTPPHVAHHCRRLFFITAISDAAVDRLRQPYQTAYNGIRIAAKSTKGVPTLRASNRAAKSSA